MAHDSSNPFCHDQYYILKCGMWDVRKPSAAEQRHLWQIALEPWAALINGQIEPLVMQFNLSPQGIETACLEFKMQNQKLPNTASGAANLHSQLLIFNSLWEACRAQARTRLEDLAQRIEPAATWDDLVLPELQVQTLQQIAAHVSCYAA